MYKSAHEPSDVIYDFSDHNKMYKYGTWLASYSICVLLMYIAYLIVDALLVYGGVAGPVAISFFNVMLPQVMKYLSMRVEIHFNNASRQSSLLLKLVVVRCINAAVLIYISAPFEETFSQDRIAAVQNTLMADAIMNPLLRFFDPITLMNRYYFSNYAKTQTELNDLFRSQEWTLAERYTDVVKSIFLSMFYTAILPSGFFISSFTIGSTYILDKWSLYRQWRRPPLFDESLSVVAYYFLVITLWVIKKSSVPQFIHVPYMCLCSTCNLIECLLSLHLSNHRTYACL